MTRPRPYTFVTTWRLDAPREAVWDEIEAGLAADDPVPWWGAVTATAVGEVSGGYDLRARSAFGYRLDFRARDLVVERPDALRFRSVGDLEGTGDLWFADTPGGGTTLTITWDVVATRPWMVRAEPVLRPVFVVAHGLVMASGERRLNRWLNRRVPRRHR